MITPKYEYKHLPQRQRRNVATTLNNADAAQWTDAYNRVVDLLGTGMIVSLLGGRGTGKTQMAVCLCREAHGRGKSFRYCTAYEMFSSIKETYRDDSASSEVVVMRYLKSPDLLILDELNEANRTTWEGHILAHLVDLRYQQEKDTLLISNYNRDQFDDAVGDSITSRIEETGGYVECTWASFRTQKAKKGNSK
jgi:DNA replication protein DnaC